MLNKEKSDEIIGFCMYDFAEAGYLNDKGHLALNTELIFSENESDTFNNRLNEWALNYQENGTVRDKYDLSVILLTHNLMQHLLTLFSKYDYISEKGSTVLNGLNILENRLTKTVFNGIEKSAYENTAMIFTCDINEIITDNNSNNGLVKDNN